MKRTATVRLGLHADGPARLALAVGVATEHAPEERFEAVQGGRPVPFRVLEEAHGGRLHLVDVEAGAVTVEYAATVEGTAPPAPVDPLDEVRYLRPSRYCESDLLAPVASAEFGGLEGEALLDAVSGWVSAQLSYVSGSSLPTDGAARTLLARRGVCRDYAHLVVAFLRALDVPARVVSVYAPGLEPMDFHAVAEASVDGAWRLVDATGLAPLASMMRIATGRDAADTAFLSVRGAAVRLDGLEVDATVEPPPVGGGSGPILLR